MQRHGTFGAALLVGSLILPGAASCQGDRDMACRWPISSTAGTWRDGPTPTRVLLLALAIGVPAVAGRAKRASGSFSRGSSGMKPAGTALPRHRRPDRRSAATR